MVLILRTNWVNRCVHTNCGACTVIQYICIEYRYIVSHCMLLAAWVRLVTIRHNTATSQKRQLIHPHTYHLTSLTGECKLDGITANTTEGIYHQITPAPLSNVLSNLFRSCTEPALCVHVCGHTSAHHKEAISILWRVKHLWHSVIIQLQHYN